MPSGTSGASRAVLDRDERDVQDGRGDEDADRLGRRPADAVRLGERVDEQDERARDQHRAERVEVARRGARRGSRGRPSG